MSAYTNAMVFLETERRYRAQVMQNTWGHLQAEPGTEHQGTILFTCGENGTYVVIRSDFPTLKGGPWEYEAMNDYIADKAKERGVVYSFVGKCRILKDYRYKFSGKVKKVL